MTPLVNGGGAKKKVRPCDKVFFSIIFFPAGGRNTSPRAIFFLTLQRDDRDSRGLLNFERSTEGAHRMTDSCDGSDSNTFNPFALLTYARVSWKNI